MKDEKYFFNKDWLKFRLFKCKRTLLKNDESCSQQNVREKNKKKERKKEEKKQKYKETNNETTFLLGQVSPKIS